MTRSTDAPLSDIPHEKYGRSHSKNSIRLWLRLLTCATEVENLLRTLVRERFGTTLPRFDILAALDRNPDGLSMGELSSLLMVSNGNVTSVVERLLADELIDRVAVEHDRRKYRVSLTPKGRSWFAEMALAHEGWVDDFFSHLSDDEIDKLLGLLNQLRYSVTQRAVAAAGESAAT